ncbi:MAG: cell division topological specificity factor MinE [Firmicutes bacterium]|jgi:cell division topological specificity factor|nr:cell division topological specificity factor MinE [Bacillota bacterium]
MLDFLKQFWNRDSDSSKQIAKERLRLVLVHDRVDVSPSLLESLKEDLLEVISKYMEIEEDGLEVNLDKSDKSVALVANIPVRRMKRAVEQSR